LKEILVVFLQELLYTVNCSNKLYCILFTVIEQNAVMDSTLNADHLNGRMIMHLFRAREVSCSNKVRPSLTCCVVKRYIAGWTPLTWYVLSRSLKVCLYRTWLRTRPRLGGLGLNKTN